MAGTELEPDDELSPWDISYELRVGSGYKDNVLLDNVASENSAFVRGGLDVNIVRLPFDGTQVMLLFSGEQTRFAEATGVDQESLLLTVAQIKKYWGEAWVAGVTAQHYYQDQVFDASTTEASRTTLRAKGHTLALRPSLRRNLGHDFWLEGELALERSLFSGLLDSFWAGGPKAAWGRNYGHRSEVALSHEFNRRSYDQRQALDATGVAALRGNGLTFEQHEVALENRHCWDAARRWRSATRLGFSANQDNGGGFFDYRRFQCSEQLRFTTRAWDLRAKARFSYYDYSTQTVSAGDPATRRKTILALEVRAERTLAKHWKVHGTWEHERSLSNLALDEYRVNTLAAGVNWDF